MSSPPKTPVYVLGVGLTPFIKPRKQRMYPELGFEAGVKAMLDAQVNYDDVETGIACYCYVSVEESKSASLTFCAH
jgi:sterol carrier protein 2